MAQADYIYFDGQPVAVLNNTTSTLYFLHDDARGTPQLAIDGSQAVQWQATYQPFGTASVSGTVTQNLRFPGQYFDVESGWNHNGFRDYLPDLGRYAEPDPLGRLGSGNNLYAYVYDNPVNLVDLLGLCERTTCVGWARISAVGGKQAAAKGALYSAYPKQAGGSILGGTFGTVAVQNGFLGLSTRQLRTWGTQISISPAFSSASVTQYGGPAGPWTVSDYGDANIQAVQGVAFDLYRFPTVQAGNQFGIENMPVTISFPTASGGKCPVGFVEVAQ